MFNKLKLATAIALAIALCLQLWHEAHAFGHARFGFSYVYRLAIVVGFAWTVLTYGRIRYLNTALRTILAVDFAHSILDRFGILGPYGAPGIAWGNWKNFVYYTHILSGLFPAATAPFFAIAATVLEVFLVVMLPLNLLTVLSCIVAGTLTAIYVITMSFTTGFASQFDYAVLLMACGCFFLATSTVLNRSSSTAPVPAEHGLLPRS